jgi:hypothetical protein
MAQGVGAAVLLDAGHDRRAAQRTREALFVLVEPRQLLSQHFLVEKHQRAQCLLVGGHRDLALGGEHGEESLDVRFAKFARMAQRVEMHKKPRAQ